MNDKFGPYKIKKQQLIKEEIQFDDNIFSNQFISKFILLAVAIVCFSVWYFFKLHIIVEIILLISGVIAAGTFILFFLQVNIFHILIATIINLILDSILLILFIPRKLINYSCHKNNKSDTKNDNKEIKET